MLFKYIHRKFYSKVGGDGGGGSSIIPEVQTLFDKAVNKQTQKLKSKKEVKE